MRERQVSSTSHPMTWLMVSSSDHITGATGLTLTVVISKDGGSFAAPAGAVSEIGNGWYALAGNATDRNTLGSFILHATATGADPADPAFDIVGYDPYNGTNAGLSCLPTANPGVASGLPVLDSSGYLETDCTRINGLPTSNVTTINANIGTTQPINFVGTGGSALVESTGSWPNQAQIATAVWQDATTGSDFTSAGSIGKLLAMFTFDGSGYVKANAEAGAWPTAAQTVTAAWQDLTSGSDFSTANSIGKLIVTNLANLDTNVGSRLAASAYTAPDNTDIAGIATIVNKLQFDGSNYVKANAEAGLWPTTAQIAAAILVTPANLLYTDSSGRVKALDSTGAAFTYSAPPAVAVDGSGRVILQPSGLDAIVVESGLNFRQSQSIIAASVAGELSGAGTTSITITGAGVSTTRLTGTVDSSGDRSSIVLSPPA